MHKVLITCFEPYGPWKENSSWLTMVELTRDLPKVARITTRRYPVDFDEVKKKLDEDLKEDFEFAIHLGQAPGTARVQLEQIAINVGGHCDDPPERYGPLSDNGPAAYLSRLPLARWANQLIEAGIPAQLSHHAGTFLCNATMYWTHYLAEQHGYQTQATFVHLPLDTSQAIGSSQNLPSLPAATSAEAVRLILKMIAPAPAPG